MTHNIIKIIIKLNIGGEFMVAKNTKTTETKTTHSSNWHAMNIFSYIAVCIGGIALFLVFILQRLGLSSSYLPIFVKIANSIAWVIVACLSFRYIEHKRKTWMWVVWAIAIVMIIIGIIF